MVWAFFLLSCPFLTLWIHGDPGVVNSPGISEILKPKVTGSELTSSNC